MNKTAYLFSFQDWMYSTPYYLLVYGESLEEAQKLALTKLQYNSGQEALLKDLKLVTYGL